jgi:UTP-glucose-1-phosphate uridylyltransferase
MLEGRARLTGAFIDFARARQGAGPGREPKLALAISAYAREHPVYAVTCEGEVIDLGSPAVPAPREHSRPSMAAGHT